MSQSAPDYCRPAAYEQFVGQLPRLDTIDGDSIMAASFGPKVSVRRGQRGEIIVNADGVEMGWGAAIKSKLITLKPGG